SMWISLPYLLLVITVISLSSEWWWITPIPAAAAGGLLYRRHWRFEQGSSLKPVRAAPLKKGSTVGRRGAPAAAHGARSNWRQTSVRNARAAILLQLPFRYRVWRPRHMRLVLEDLARRGGDPSHDDKVHLMATLDWLCLAQDVRDRQFDAGGVSAGW